MSDTWTPGDTFQLAARGDRFDGTTGRIRRLWTADGRQQAHVTHDDGTITSWPVTRLEKPTDPSGGAVTSTPAPSGVPAIVQLDQDDAAGRALAALVEWRKAGDVQAHILATVALRKAADEYITAVSR